MVDSRSIRFPSLIVAFFLACTPHQEGAPVAGASGSAAASVTAQSTAPTGATMSLAEFERRQAGAKVPSGAPANAEAAELPEEPGDRIYAKGRFVWIQPTPGARGWIGYLTLGGSVRLYEGSRDKARTEGPGCAWYRVEPRGYVCNGPETTLDPSDPEYVALKDHRGRAESPYPFEYGESLGTPRYFSPPTPDYQRAMEIDRDKHLRFASVERANVPLPTLPPLPKLVHENRDKVIQGSTVAWSKQYDDDEGRTWLYTSDHALVPKDRVKPYPKVAFAGVHLNAEVRLPIAFFRKKDRPKLHLVASGASRRAEVATETFARLSWVMLTGDKERIGSITYLETREAGVWVDAADVTIAEEAQTIPFAVDELAGARRTWVDVSVLGGTLVAYEGPTPIFATLVSPGRGGIPFPGKDPVSTASTPTGTFRVDGKFRWATMVSSSDSSIVHSEVQWVQNFHGPHALHGAYWHDAWGELKSGGCVNLSPIDSKWLFDWSEPKLPRDWQGIRSVSDFGPATRVVVRR